MIYDRFNEKIAIKSRNSVSQPTWGGPGYVGKTGTHSNRLASELFVKVMLKIFNIQYSIF